MSGDDRRDDRDGHSASPEDPDGGKPIYRTSVGMRQTADEIRRRSAEIRREAERIRSLSMITMLNVEINYRTAHKAYRTVMRDAEEEG